MKIMVVSAISREDSSCFILAAKLCEMAKAQGVEVDFTHPAEADLPVNDGTLAWDDARSVAWQQRVAEMQAHMWVSPEYHSGMTGGLKNLFDHLAKEPMKGDVVGPLRAGRRGDGRAEHAQQHVDRGPLARRLGRP